MASTKTSTHVPGQAEIPAERVAATTPAAASKAALQFPFSAVAGQTTFKLALILAAIYPAIGGVLVSGPRGSAKSTLARGLADVCLTSPSQQPCPFVTLPLGATEEMLVGTLDLQQVLQQQSVSFQEGLLAKANGGVLYVDEVNLLADNLVDLLLDVATSGTNIIERDGISHHHDARFLLMGTMNPDEGELRPQLHDRFGFSVTLDNQYSVAERVEIVRLREAFDRHPEAFIAQYQPQQDALANTIRRASQLVDNIQCDDQWRILIAERCHEANVDGLRADIVWYRAAVAHAAWRLSRDHSSPEGSNLHVIEEDILAVETLVLSHRRQTPPQPPSSGPSSTGRSDAQKSEPQAPSKPSFSRPPERSQQHSQQPAPQDQASQTQTVASSKGDASRQSNHQSSNEQSDWGSMQAPPQSMAASTVAIALPAMAQQKKTDGRNGNDPQALLEKIQGQHHAQHTAVARSAKGKKGKLYSRSVDWFSSLVSNKGRWPLSSLSYRKAPMSQSVMHLVLLDTSASTLQQGLLANAKAAIMAIAERAYWQRESIHVMGFGNEQITTLLSQRKTPKVLKHWLDSITAAGGTPLREALQQALVWQTQYYRQHSHAVIHTYVITDGKTTQTVDDLHLLGNVMVIDTEHSGLGNNRTTQYVKRGKAQGIANALGASYFPLPI